MRADQLLVERGLAADALAGAAPDRVGRALARRRRGWSACRARTATSCRREREVELLDDAEARYVSRGGLKLEGALRATRHRRRRQDLPRRRASPPAASPTACCSTARRAWSASTSATASCTTKLRARSARDAPSRRSMRASCTARAGRRRLRPGRRRPVVHLADAGAAGARAAAASRAATC